MSALDALASGSQASTTSEVDFTGAGVLTEKVVMQLSVDVTNMVSGDIVIFRMYRKVRTGGSSFLCDKIQVDWNDLVAGIVEMDPHLSPYEARFTIERFAGSDRTYNWEVNEV